ISRFFVSVESEDSGNSDQFQYFAVSKDATGASFFLYRIAIKQGAAFFCVPSTVAFWDYPHPGWVNGSNPRWFFTANVFPSGAPEEDAPAAPFLAGAGVISIEKTQTLSGAATTAACLSQTLNFNIAPPLVQDNNSVAFFLSTGAGGGNSITRY